MDVAREVEALTDRVVFLRSGQVLADAAVVQALDADWTVGGSVSHFGHTHYRQNRYHALVTFMMDDNIWKIRGIELIDEKRLI